MQDALPEMKETLVKKGVAVDMFDPYKSVKCLTDFTLKNAHKHNIKMLQRCFAVAEKLYTKGNVIIKNAISNVFVRSLSMLFADCGSRLEKAKIQSVMPCYLYSAYVQQILNQIADNEISKTRNCRKGGRSWFIRFIRNGFTGSLADTDLAQLFLAGFPGELISTPGNILNSFFI